MSLTAAQKTTLKAAILADPTMNAFPNTVDGNINLCSEKLNVLASPAFIVWRSRVPFIEVGDATSAADLAAITSINSGRYGTIMDISPDGVAPTLDRRTAFEDIFSGANGANTRPKLGLAGTVWKRSALVGEKILATGTGSDASPATLGYEGNLYPADVQDARNA